MYSRFTFMDVARAGGGVENSQEQGCPCLVLFGTKTKRCLLNFGCIWALFAINPEIKNLQELKSHQKHLCSKIAKLKNKLLLVHYAILCKL